MKELFEKHLRIISYSIENIIIAKLTRYYNGAFTIDKEYYDDMLFFAKNYKGVNIASISNSYIYIPYYWTRSPFELFPFFVCKKGKKTYNAKASELFLGEEYGNNVARYLKKVEQIDFLSPEYKRQYTNEELKVFLEFAIYCGLRTTIVIEKCNARNNPNYYNKLSSDAERVTDCQTNIDFTIKNIEKLLKQKSVEISYIIWDLLIKLSIENIRRNNNERINIMVAQYAPNNSARIKSCDSTLLYYLKNNAWIPNKDGTKFFVPGDIDIHDIHPNLVYQNVSCIKALKIGSNLSSEAIQLKKLRIEAEKLGYILVKKKK